MPEEMHRSWPSGDREKGGKLEEYGAESFIERQTLNG